MICECNYDMTEVDIQKATIKYACSNCNAIVTKIMRAPSRILKLSRMFEDSEIEAQTFIAEVIEALEDSKLATAGWHRDE